MARARKSTTRAEIAERKRTMVSDEILMSASHLIAERGYRAITMDNIAASLSYTKSVVYYYFNNKNELLWEIFKRTFDTYSSQITAILDRKEPPEIALRVMLRQHAMLVMENADWTAIYNKELAELTQSQRQQLSRLKRDYDEMFWSVYRKGVESGVFHDLPVHIVIGGMLGMCNWLYSWYNPKGPMPSREIAEQFDALLWQGYKAE